MKYIFTFLASLMICVAVSGQSELGYKGYFQGLDAGITNSAHQPIIYNGNASIANLSGGILMGTGVGNAILGSSNYFTFLGYNSLYEDIVGIEYGQTGVIGTSTGDFVVRGDDNNAGNPALFFQWATGNIYLEADTINGGALHFIGRMYGDGGGISNIPISDPPFSIAVIPDSQYLVESLPSEWFAQINWIVNNATEYNIKAVIHVGDCVNVSNPSEWSTFMSGITNLRTAGIPILIVAGNHDVDVLTSSSQSLVNMSAYVYPSWFSNYSNYGSNWSMGFQNPANLLASYLIFTNAQQPYIIGGCSWLPGTNTMTWMTNVFLTYSNVPAIYDQHVWISSDVTQRRSSWSDPYGVERGCGFGWGNVTALSPNWCWTNYLNACPNLFWITSGHEIPYSDPVLGANVGENCNYLFDRGIDGHIVTQTLQDFQNYNMTGNIGSNFFQLAQFTPSRNQVCVHTISPTFLTYPTNTYDATYTFPICESSAMPLTTFQKAQTQNLLLYLNFDNPSGFNDLSPYAAAITNYGCTVSNSLLGRSLYFGPVGDTTNTLSVGYPLFNQFFGAKDELDQFTGLSNITISFWENTTNTPSTMVQYVSKFEGGTQGEWYVGVGNGNNTFVDFTTVTGNSVRYDLTGFNSGSISDGNWHHIVATYNGAIASIYVDNTLINSGAVSGSFTPSPYSVQIGGYSAVGQTASQAACAPGYIDEVKILSTAWTPEQISQEYYRVRGILTVASSGTATNVSFTTYAGYLGSQFLTGVFGTNWQVNFATNSYDVTIGTNGLCISNCQSLGTGFNFVDVYIVNTNTITPFPLSLSSNSFSGGWPNPVMLTNSVKPWHLHGSRTGNNWTNLVWELSNPGI